MGYPRLDQDIAVIGGDGADDMPKQKCANDSDIGDTVGQQGRASR
ncbi:hypothetical protein CCUG60884_03125 [Mycobacteroides salmoniphilum]|uniref:Uncharacterized protein n=1 Tax=Mycobacteroides salmoniphilum TaxID=404941 RepID=A0A4V3I1I4_9MYCO|nr:hypothetical protein CCUG60884_03125 [Mycobacteroides salmoniphilum]